LRRNPKPTTAMPSVIATTQAMSSLLIDATYREQMKVPLQRFVPNGEIIVPVEAALDLAPQAENQDHAYRPLSVPRTDVPKKSP
jgi:hypothetical protein